jgi:hypothetical protein
VIVKTTLSCRNNTNNCQQGAGEPSPQWKTINPFTTACSPGEVGPRQKTDSSSYLFKIHKSGQFICYKTGQVYLLLTQLCWEVSPDLGKFHLMPDSLYFLR